MAKELQEVKEMDVWAELAESKAKVDMLQMTVDVVAEEAKQIRRDNALLRLKLAKATGELDGLVNAKQEIG